MRTQTMRDPTREEMLDVLLDQSSRLGADPDTLEIAIYWFAMYWHSGQGSNLYSVLSTSPYSPGLCGRLESEGDMVQLCYDALEAEYNGPLRVAPVRPGPLEPEPRGCMVDPIRMGMLT